MTPTESQQMHKLSTVSQLTKTCREVGRNCFCGLTRLTVRNCQRLWCRWWSCCWSHWRPSFQGNKTSFRVPFCLSLFFFFKWNDFYQLKKSAKSSHQPDASSSEYLNNWARWWLAIYDLLFLRAGFFLSSCEGPALIGGRDEHTSHWLVAPHAPGLTGLRVHNSSLRRRPSPLSCLLPE